MRDSVMWFLVASVVISALVVVNVRHQHRVAYLSFQAQEARRDALNDEWGQLLVEENLWSFPHRIEKDAVKLLSMRAPNKDEILFVGLEQTEATDVQ
ncbi:MAG: cell division protein FtsL [Acidiferrobacterales bacterium]|nr:cell division protein FtsL [Acidiferrobacterales bacterium]